LLLGDSGAGKSTFLERFCYREHGVGQEEVQASKGGGAEVKESETVQGKWQPGQPIPLFMPLPKLKKPLEEAVEEVLREGFSEEEIKELKKHERFHLFFDAYDELNEWESVYAKNSLESWKVEKMVVTCRAEHVTNAARATRNIFRHAMRRGARKVGSASSKCMYLQF